ncbi:DUF418 domain-containing protein [Flavobacterium capsici]|uniref:DUF418 domain-containing protein n=1 Tax=Flavobacterium capsici TaxID=3075618 RepID=A0AA96J8S3_9FLAO|nr:MULTISPECIES: DUF418 domain-containing protein [unclassified Flavobacterium]WNM18675.1 DUF418 domain-containing protein [Flavobacterium sp. PMR2A8]WNM22726.1 DUF418 domain-containing protein [Flavobacterium sp. PMTSA4]
MEPNQNQVLPIQKEDRIDFLDIMRGIAIFFIFTANIPVFSGLFFLSDEIIKNGITLPTDDWVDIILYTIVDGKFYTIFSLLFGIGITIQYENLIARNQSFGSFFKKRMFWLLVIGAIHISLFWVGDILTLYAFLGSGLLIFIKTDNKKLIRLSIILLLLPILNTIIIHYFHLDYPKIFLETNAKIANYFHLVVAERNGVMATNFGAMLKNESLITFFQTNFSNVFVRIYYLFMEGRLFKVFGIFLIGIWFGRQILHHNLLTNNNLLKKIALYGFLIGLPISISRTFFTFTGDDSFASQLSVSISYALGTVPLALGYFAGLALLYQKRKGFLNNFAPVGKMALSNYLFQTLISITLFYNVGFGLAGKFGFTIIIGIVITLFIFQILLSKLWLQHFRFGPIEWIWRQLTYGTKLKLKK